MKNSINLLAAGVFMLSACGGGGGGGETISTAPLASVPAKPVGTVSINGKITFDFVPTAVNAGVPFLDYPNTVRRPARGLLVEVVDASTQATLGTTTSDTNGNYAVQAPTGINVLVRANAILSPNSGNTVDVLQVVDNTQGDAGWALDSSAFITPATVVTKNLNASSGWNGTSYTATQRTAGPYAILDTIYTAVQKIKAVDSAAVFPKLSIHWSSNNIPASGNIAAGQIGSSYFSNSNNAVSGAVVTRDLYILGKENIDTDEYDSHVIAHEFGHYLQNVFSRDDSIGGQHGGADDRLDMRVAFSEGWGYAWAAYVLNNPISTDVNSQAQTRGSAIDVAAGESVNSGWFKEKSVQKIIYDIINSAAIGFEPVWTALKTGIKATPALTSIHSLAYALRQANASYEAPLNAILTSQNITPPMDSYGANETNFGSPVIASLNPIYLNYGAVSSTLNNVCVTDAVDSNSHGNKAGEYRFIKINLPSAGNRTFSVTKAKSSFPTDPDFSVYDKNGRVVNAASDGVDTQSATKLLPAGDYVLALTDYNFSTNKNFSAPCFSLTIN